MLLWTKLIQVNASGTYYLLINKMRVEKGDNEIIYERKNCENEGFSFYNFSLTLIANLSQQESRRF
jgi:hypothetical protein